MADFNFRPAYVPWTPDALACRAALLPPLLGRPALTDADARAAVAGVLALWRDRAAALGQAGWAPGQGRQLQYLRNCEPLGVAMRPACYGHASRACQCRLACPWCWCRRVVLPALDRLVPLAVRYGPALADHTLALDAEAAPWGPAALDLERGPRHWGAAEELGAVVTVTAAPAEDGLVRTARRLALVRSAGHAADLRPPVLAALAAAVAPYPAALLLGEVAPAVAALRAAAGLRALRTAGLFYGASWEALARAAYADAGVVPAATAGPAAPAA
jgi:hypothetical protein